MVILTGTDLTLEDIEAVAKRNAKVKIGRSAFHRVQKSREIVEQRSKEEKHYYAINTGFGALCHVKISKQDLEKLQVNLLRSHAVGVGDLFSEDVVRAAMLPC